VAGKPRVHEIAAELGIDSKRTLEKLKEIGEFVKGPSSTVEPPVARKLKAAFAEEGVVPVPKEEKPEPKAAPKPAAPVVDEPAAEAPVAPEKPATPEDGGAPPTKPGIPRPGNNPFASSQGMAKPGIPRPVTILSLPLRAWVDPRLRAPDRERCRAVLPPVRVGLVRLSSNVPVVLVAPAVGPAALAEVPVVDPADRVPVAVAPVLAVAVAAPEGVPQVPSVAVAARASLVSRSGRRGKSMKCGRRQA